MADYTIKCKDFDDQEDYTISFITENTEEDYPEISLTSITPTEEKKEVEININGGSRKWHVASIYGYDDGQQMPFDNGFVYYKVNKDNENKLVITNYGRTLMKNGEYYVLTICHNDDFSVRASLKIGYDEVIDVEEQVEEETQQPRTLKAMAKPHFEQNVSPIEENDEEDYVIEYSIRWNNKEEMDEYVINDLDIFGFTVYEKRSDCDDEIISDIAVGVFSSAKWCKANLKETDKYNRELYIRMADRPIGVRYSVVKLYILDYPEIEKTFIVKNC